MGFTTIFGLPRSGKTTFATSIAVKEQRKIDKGISKYDYVYTNFAINYPNIRQIDTDTELGQVEITDSLIILDEATMVADARNYKAIPKFLRKYFFLHGHWRVDLIFIVQDWSSLDLGIRRCTERVYYVHKGTFLRGVSYCMPIPYDIIIPDPKKSDGEKLGEIIQGYCKPNLLVRMFQPRIWRRKWYKYFDSWSHDELPPYKVRTWFKEENTTEEPSEPVTVRAHENRSTNFLDDFTLDFGESTEPQQFAAQPDAAQPDAAQPDAAQPDVAQPDVAQPDVAQTEEAEQYTNHEYELFFDEE